MFFAKIAKKEIRCENLYVVVVSPWLPGENNLAG
jgi:hypothetical protein